MTVPVIRTPYLIEERSFPENIQELTTILDKMYSDISRATNAREIGIYDKFEIVSGRKWYNDTDPSKRRQSYRQLYTFTNATNASNPNSITHNIDTISEVVDYWGQATTSTDFRRLPYASITADANIELRITSTDIEILLGSASPNLISGFVIVEYILAT